MFSSKTLSGGVSGPAPWITIQINAGGLDQSGTRLRLQADTTVSPKFDRSRQATNMVESSHCCEYAVCISFPHIEYIRYDIKFAQL